MSVQEANKPLFPPIAGLRSLVFGATFLIGLSLALRQPTAHDACLGGALGLLLGACVYACDIRKLELKNTPQPSDANEYRITS